MRDSDVREHIGPVLAVEALCALSGRGNEAESGEYRVWLHLGSGSAAMSRQWSDTLVYGPWTGLRTGSYVPPWYRGLSSKCDRVSAPDRRSETRSDSGGLSDEQMGSGRLSSDEIANSNVS